MEVRNRVKALPWQVLGSELLYLLTAVASCQARREEAFSAVHWKEGGHICGPGSG